MIGEYYIYCDPPSLPPHAETEVVAVMILRNETIDKSARGACMHNTRKHEAAGVFV